MPPSWSTSWTSPAYAAWVPCSPCCTRPVAMLQSTITTTLTSQCQSINWKNTCRYRYVFCSQCNIFCCVIFPWQFFTGKYMPFVRVLSTEISDLCCPMVLLWWWTAQDEGWAWRIYPAHHHCTPTCCSQCPHYRLWGTTYPWIIKKKKSLNLVTAENQTIITVLVIISGCWLSFSPVWRRCVSQVSGSPGKARCHRLRSRPTKWHPLMLWFPLWTLSGTRLCFTHGWQSINHWCCVDLLALEKQWLCSVPSGHCLIWRSDTWLIIQKIDNIWLAMYVSFTGQVVCMQQKSHML